MARSKQYIEYKFDPNFNQKSMSFSRTAKWITKPKIILNRKKQKKKKGVNIYKYFVLQLKQSPLSLLDVVVKDRMLDLCFL